MFGNGFTVTEKFTGVLGQPPCVEIHVTEYADVLGAPVVTIVNVFAPVAPPPIIPGDTASVLLVGQLIEANNSAL